MLDKKPAHIAMGYSNYAKLRILSLYWSNYSVCAIMEYQILEDGIQTTRQVVHQLIKRYKQHNTIVLRPGSGSPPKLSPEVIQIIENAMQEDDETTATRIQTRLALSNMYQ